MTHDSAMNRDDVPTPATAQTKLRHVGLSERSQAPQKPTRDTILFAKGPEEANLLPGTAGSGEQAANAKESTESLLEETEVFWNRVVRMVVHLCEYTKNH